ncbi:hypothetical protein QOZ80_3BG0286850 [Eleusine coracana subsp. coracana]|nr:hypothetical protein QOZ80_3BG0286850 [Eleusine coracana subsp. coracana]
MASKSMASPAAALLFLAMGLMLATSAQAQTPTAEPTPAPEPTPGPTPPTPAPGPSQAMCPAGFANLSQFTRAAKLLLPQATLLLLLPASAKPIIDMNRSISTNIVTVCACYYSNLFVFGPYKCEAVSK